MLTERLFYRCGTLVKNICWRKNDTKNADEKYSSYCRKYSLATSNNDILCMFIYIWGGKIKADLYQWINIMNLSSKSDYWAFVYLLMTFPELRSIFYWRLGKIAKLFFFWMPGRSNLYLYTSPKNVDGGFYVSHGWGTVVNAKRIGRNFRVSQNVTLGSRNSKEPIIGDNVSVWANAVVLGDINLGSNSQIGAGAVVVKTVKDNSVVVPAKSVIIKQNGKRVTIPL